MFTQASIAFGAAMVEAPDRHDLSAFEVKTASGEGANWEAAKAACMIPDGSLILH